jgi:predicted aspartyl protease
LTRRILFTLSWLASLAAAFLLGRMQLEPPPPPPAAALAGAAPNVGSAAARSDSGRAEILLHQHDWEALAADVWAGNRTAWLLASLQAMAAEGRVNDALALLNAYLQWDRSADVLFVASDLLMMTGQMREALEPLFQILDYPETPEIAQRARQRLNLIINALEQQLINSDDVAGLVLLFEQLALREPGYDRHRLKLAGWLLRSGDIAAARTLTRELGTSGVSDAEREALVRELAVAESPLPFQRQGPGYFAQVDIPAQRRDRAGAQSVRLLVDTGATTTSIGLDLLQRLGARRLDRSARVNTANGITEMATYRISGLRVGELEIPDLVVLALPDPPHDADGLLGMDVLDRLPKAVGTP